MYLTGNVNLRVPFAFKGEKKKRHEIMLPIHCAIEGRNERLVRWLVDVQYCPLHVLSTGTIAKSPSASGGGSVASTVISAGAGIIKSLGSVSGDSKAETKYNFVPTLKTSVGRSILDIAMEGQHVGILRYLIHEKNVSVYEVKNLELALMSVEALVRAFPSVDGTYDPSLFVDSTREAEYNHGGSGEAVLPSAEERTRECAPSTTAAARKNNEAKQKGVSPKKERVCSHSLFDPSLKQKILLPRDTHGFRTNENRRLYGVRGYDGNDNDHSDDNIVDENNDDSSDDDNSVSTTVPEICILCREKDVDCVAAPCGHRMCCLDCSKTQHRCPVCKSGCYFIEMYHP